MIRFILSRFLQGIIVIVAVASITFLMMRASPGSPFAKERHVSEAQRADLEKHYGLDKPWYVQLGKNLKDLATLNYPMSYSLKGWSVGDIIALGFPISLTVGGAALLIGIGIGVPAGAIAALRAGTYIDRSVMLTATLGVCVPSLVLGPLVALFFGLKLHWFNTAGWYDRDDWVLPSMTLGLISAAAIARLTRGGLRETLAYDFIRTARAKGASERSIIFRHAFKTACLPLINYLGPLAAGLVSGSFITETVFQLPGLGQHFINSALHLDYTLALWLSSLFATLIVTFNFLVDILQAWLNPRIRLKG